MGAGVAAAPRAVESCRVRGEPMRRHARVPLVVNPTLKLSAVVEASRRGVGRRQLEIVDEAAVRFLLTTRVGGRLQPRLGSALRRRLRGAGVLIRPRDVPHDVYLDARLGADRAVVPKVPAGGRLHSGPGLPPVFARRCPVAEPFLPSADILWVPRPGSGMLLPYTLAPGLASVLRERRRAPRVSAAGAARVRAAWARQLRAWRGQLRQRGVAVLRGLFEPIFLEAMRVYYRRLEREGYLLDGEPRRRGAPLVHDEPLLTFLGAQLAPVVRSVTGERTRSTFMVLRVYDPGAILARHRDQAVCRWNVDLVVGGAPAAARRDAWPLWMDGPRGLRPLRLGLGDGVLYRGDRVRHWRRPQPRGRTTAVAALHYGRAVNR